MQNVPNPVVDQIDQIRSIFFSAHPFSTLEKNQVPFLLAQYLAMSQAFPYLQAGSQKDLILRCVATNCDVPSDVEMTSVVGNFLSWDETGGFYLMRHASMERLPEILNPQNFHANMLREDIEAILGYAVSPDYSGATGVYLQALLDSLGDPDPVARCATMVSFEAHAGQMIEALWNSLASLFRADKETLKYFRVHVGGDDPAEVHHIAMTQRMIDAVVPARRRQEFLRRFTDRYHLHFDWCAAISRSRPDDNQGEPRLVMHTAQPADGVAA